MAIVSEPVGRVLGNRYRIVAALGSGASAHVFLAEDMVLQRPVALKVLQPALAGDEAFLRRFRAEARSVAALNHPHVLRVFDWGEGDGGPYLVLEYLEGGSLLDMLAGSSRLSASQAARVGAQAAEGLAYAHARGIVHRDVKPANILFDEEGRVRVADFGVARALSSASTTDQGMMLGTARYASPEQAQGLPLDGRSDVYSLALVLYESMTGEVPFSGETPHATLQARIGGRLPEDPALGPLAQLLTTAAAPDPAGRYDAEAFARRLQRLAEDLSPGAPLPLVRRAPPDGVVAGAPDLGAGSLDDARGAGDTAATTSVLLGAADAGRVPPTLLVAPAGAAALVPLARGSEAGLVDPGEPTATIALGGARGIDLSSAAALRGVRRRRRWLGAAATVLVACIVAAGVVYAMRSHLFGETDHVPKVVGDTVASARRALLADHFVVKVEPAVHSTSVGAGRIVGEVPSAGTLLSSGSTVELVPSKGEPDVAVPSLSADVDCVIAAQLLEEVHLHANCPAASTYSASVPLGDVVSWSYAGGLDPKTAPYGATIVVTVSAGRPPVVLPTLAGEPWTGADSTLTSDGLVPQEAGAYSTTVGSGDVISTTPPAGATLAAGSAVTVTVSEGPQYVPVPDVVGDTASKATAAIVAAGLAVDAVYGPKTGEVFTTDPLAGQKEKLGTAVALYTETPPPGPTAPTATRPSTGASASTGPAGGAPAAGASGASGTSGA